MAIAAIAIEIRALRSWKLRAPHGFNAHVRELRAGVHQDELPRVPRDERESEAHEPGDHSIARE